MPAAVEVVVQNTGDNTCAFNLDVAGPVFERASNGTVVPVRATF